jgi:ATP-dependent DNA helicase RecG
MYPNHIDIENPGGLFRGLTLSDLGKKSVRRNRLIADLLHRAGYIERVGSGFSRMQKALEENQNPKLEVISKNFFNIRFYKRKPDFNLRKLSSRQLSLYQAILERKIISKKEAALSLGVSEDTALRELKSLMALDLIEKQGEGKSTLYALK